MVGIVAGLLIWLMFVVIGILVVTEAELGFMDGIAIGSRVGFPNALAGGLAVAITSTSWGQFIILRAWLAARGRLPLRLMAFLEDAHRRGVLRQVGAVYQFRHVRLQDHLASYISPHDPELR
jgi:hypothetical protein